MRTSIADLTPGSLVVVACSGGADSLALVAATAHEARTLALRVISVTVDHGLQPGSDAVSIEAAERCRLLGVELAARVVVQIEDRGLGPEGGARTSRYAAIDAFVDEHGAAAVLLGHTLDDQAEQVLLGLVRGSGARSLSGMPRVRGRYRRPFLDVTRVATRDACRRLGINWWDDPMNADPAFTRVRVRTAIGDLERDLGPGVGAALARSAWQLREDADYLDGLAHREVSALGSGPWAANTVRALARPVRTRVWRRLLLAAGAPPGQVGARHTDACDALLTDWHGQGPVHVPGNLRVVRDRGLVSVLPALPGR